MRVEFPNKSNEIVVTRVHLLAVGKLWLESMRHRVSRHEPEFGETEPAIYCSKGQVIFIG